MKKILSALFLLGVALMPARSDASSICVADVSCSFSLNDPGGLGSGGPFGTVTVQLLSNYLGSGKNAIQFSIALVSGAVIVDTGNSGNHAPFAFNYSGSGTVTLSSFSNTHYSQGSGTQTQSPFGDFNTSVAFDCHGGGACANAANSLSFIATSSSVGGFANLGEVINPSTSPIAYFTADLLYQGNTGVVGANTSTTIIHINNVPEPQSAALLGTGLLGLAFAAKRMRRK